MQMNRTKKHRIFLSKVKITLSLSASQLMFGPFCLVRALSKIWIQWKGGKCSILLLILQVCIDETNKIVTSPAFMYDAQFHQVHDGVAKMVESVIGMLWKKTHKSKIFCSNRKRERQMSCSPNVFTKNLSEKLIPNSRESFNP